jgi:hypothetical protein
MDNDDWVAVEFLLLWDETDEERESRRAQHNAEQARARAAHEAARREATNTPRRGPIPPSIRAPTSSLWQRLFRFLWPLS